jgi:hypothetical protein
VRGLHPPSESEDPAAHLETELEVHLCQHGTIQLPSLVTNQ